MSAKLDPISEFRDDHRKVRDGILEITEALKKKDVPKARKVLNNLNVLVGPHFRYEEEHLYPALRKFLGEYVDQLISEHDKVIETAQACAELLAKDTLSSQEAEDAQKAAMALLIHVSNCDGLAILSERFNTRELDDLSNEYLSARKAGVPLLEWAEKIRKH